MEYLFLVMLIYKYPIKKGSYKTYKFKDNIIYGDNEILFTFPKINKMYLRNY